MLYANWQIHAAEEKKKTFTPYAYPNKPNLKCFKDETGRVYRSDDPNYDPRNPHIWTREEIAVVIQKRINESHSKTQINLSDDEPTRSGIPLNWKIPWSGSKPTMKQMSMIEAHEMGHRIRNYQHLGEYFSKGFDTTKVEYTDKDLKVDTAMLKKGESYTVLSLDVLRSKLIKYLFSGQEIAERMSQLKNYFGMRGSERFTKEHLRYAREHYIMDTDMNNRMTQFFQAITPETEDAFIELINTSGI